MKRFAGVALGFAFVACASRGGVSVVSVPLPSSPAVESGTRASDCRIVGTGERSRDDEEVPELGLFLSRSAKKPALVITETSNANVTWSKFPSSPSDESGRAHVDIGGQSHLRFAGWAALRGRRFSATQRLFAEPKHLWARTGAPVEMMAVEGGVAVARVVTPFAAPKTLAVRGACDAIVYRYEEPSGKEDPDPETTDTVTNKALALDLYVEPAAAPFTAITLEHEAAISLGVVERRDAFVRVVANEGEIGFDAWVRAEQIEDDGVGMIGISGMSASSSCGGGPAGDRGVIAHDAPLFIGVSPIAIEDAFVEANADIVFDGAEAKTVGRDVVVPFEFIDGMIHAAGDDAHMWVRRDAIKGN